MKKILIISLVVALLIPNLAYAKKSSKEASVLNHSVTINGEIVQDLGTVVEEVADGEIVQYSSEYWIDDYVEDSFDATYIGYDYKHKHFFNTSVTIPQNTNYTYTWITTVEETDTSSHDIDTGVRAQGGVGFITELEGHLNYTYNTSSTVKVTSGTNTSIGFMTAGSWDIDWYFKAKKYNVYCDWYKINTYTGEINAYPRYVASLEESTKFLHCEVTSN